MKWKSARYPPTTIHYRKCINTDTLFFVQIFLIFNNVLKSNQKSALKLEMNEHTEIEDH